MKKPDLGKGEIGPGEREDWIPFRVETIWVVDG
jgi:hypothetical protein